MEYWIPRDAAQLKSQLWHIASALSVHWPQNTPLKVQNVQKFTAFVKSVFFFFPYETWLCGLKCNKTKPTQLEKNRTQGRCKCSRILDNSSLKCDKATEDASWPQSFMLTL